MLAAPRAIVRRALGDPELTKELELSGEDVALRRDYDALARAARGDGVVPELTGDNSLGQARALDAWRALDRGEDPTEDSGEQR